METIDVRAERLVNLIDECHRKADELQRIYIDIDKIKMEMERRQEVFDMVSITRLAEKLKTKNIAITAMYDRIAAEG